MSNNMLICDIYKSDEEPYSFIINNININSLSPSESELMEDYLFIEYPYYHKLILNTDYLQRDEYQKDFNNLIYLDVENKEDDNYYYAVALKSWKNIKSKTIVQIPKDDKKAISEYVLETLVSNLKSSYNNSKYLPEYENKWNDTNNFSTLPPSMTYLNFHASALLRVVYKNLNYIFLPVNKNHPLFNKYAKFLYALSNDIDIYNIKPKFRVVFHPIDHEMNLHLYSSKMSNRLSHFFRKNDNKASCKICLVTKENSSIVGISMNSYLHINTAPEAHKYYYDENITDSIIFELIKDAIYSFFKLSTN